MKYLEELKHGDSFSYNGDFYILTPDYSQRKKLSNHCCVNLQTGHLHWLPSDSMVEQEPIYTLDKENNIIALKITEKENVS